MKEPKAIYKTNNNLDVVNLGRLIDRSHLHLTIIEKTLESAEDLSIKNGTKS